MKLTDLHVQCLLAAAHSHELVKREWLLDSMTVMSEYSHNITTTQRPKVGQTIQIEAAVADAEYGQVVAINNQLKGIVLDSQGMLLTIGVLALINEPIYHRLDIFTLSSEAVKQKWGACAFATGDVNQPTTVGRFLENVIVLDFVL